MEWYLKVLKNYANFEGRARRKEYWMFVLFNYIFLFILAIPLGLVADSGNEALSGIFGGLLVLYLVAIIIPTLAVAVRRLHDIGKSGWMYCVSFIPFIGGIWLLVLMVTEGDVGDNQYGPDPKPLPENF